MGITHTAQPLGYGWTTEEAWVRFPEKRIWGPPSLLFNGYWNRISGSERPGHDRDHSPPFSAEVRMSTVLPPFPHTPSWLAKRLLCTYLLLSVFATWKQLTEK